MSFRYFNILSWVIFIFLLLCNLIVYTFRNNGFVYKEFLTYSQLYESIEKICIDGFIIRNNDSLEVICKFPDHKKDFQIFQTDDNLIKRNPIIKLKKGKHIYKIKENTKLELGLNYVTKEEYANRGRQKESDIELFYSNINFNGELKYTTSDWIQNSKYTTYPELLMINQIIRDRIMINSNDSSFSKIKKIANYIYKQIDACRGIPISKMDELSPLNQLYYAINKKSKIWCGNFADIFSFISNASGIKTRLVCTEGKINEIFKSGHSFNECYIEELGKWVMVDITSKMIFARTSSGCYLNTIDFFNSHQLNQQDIQIDTYENDSILLRDYSKFKNFYDYYFNYNTQFVFYLNSQFSDKTYSFLSKIGRYVSQSPTFAIYSGTNNNSNERFYLKRHLFYFLIIFSLFWLLMKLYFFLKR